MEKPKYPVGIQTFSKIREGNFVYVDKTEYIYRLVTGSSYYFLSRPRRFGKSLLLSTIEALFRAQRHLFDGLFISGAEWDWVEHPVFHLALNGQNYDSVRSLDEILNYNISLWEEQYGIPRDETLNTSPARFMNIIHRVYEKTGRQVVILIDEYDQPLLQNIEEGKENLHNEIRMQLQAFYSVMKVQDRYIRFAMLSGISKFSKVSVFSGLNNLQDISLDKRFNAICGISESELLRDFTRGIADLAQAEDMSVEQIREKLRKEFDGYHFAKSGEGIYNPFSLLNTFDTEDFRHYWAASGTPSFLISLLRRRHWDLRKINGSKCSEDDLMGADRYLTNPIPLLYQSGYLTIKGYDKDFNEFTMGYPNEEVSEGFAADLLRRYSGDEDSDFLIKQFVKYVRSGEAKKFMETLKSFTADVPYEQIVDRELHFQNLMYLVMKLMGFYTHTEYRTSDGRIDMVVETDRYVYLMEFKLRGSVDDALAQIRDKEYILPFLKEGKEIVLIGAEFSADKRRLGDWRVEHP